MKLLHSLIARSLPLAPKSLVRRFASPYVAGESESAALDVVSRLNASRMSATLDVLGEDITELSAASATAEAYVHLLDSIARLGLDTNVSIKLSALGLKLDRECCVQNLRTVLGCAAKHGNFTRLDMEDSSCTDDTLAIFAETRSEYPALGVVLQACLKRTVGDARKLAKTQAGVRVCKGIYIEPEAIAYRDREEIRESFLLTVELLLDGGSRVGIATHDDVLVEATNSLLRDKGIGPDSGRYEFQMLLGVRPKLRDDIVAAGHPLRVYVPFGDQWYAYSVRRLRENPEIAGHVLRGLMRGEGFRESI